MSSSRRSAAVGVAIVWAAVILATMLVLDGTPYFAELLPVLGGGAAGSLLVVAGTVAED